MCGLLSSHDFDDVWNASNCIGLDLRWSIQDRLKVRVEENKSQTDYLI